MLLKNDASMGQFRPVYDKPCRLEELYDNVIVRVCRQAEIDCGNGSFSIVIAAS